MDRKNLRLILVQCESGDERGNLIACARYSIESEMKQLSISDVENVFVMLIVQIPRVTGRYFTGFQCGTWQSVHIDELRATCGIPNFIDMYQKPVSAVLETYLHTSGTSGVQFDVISLIWGCMQQALATVKDRDEVSNRNTERVKLVFNAKDRNTAREGTSYVKHAEESEQNQNTFVSGLALHLITIMKEKEEYINQHQWLITEAAKAAHINRAGTFRRSVMQYIEGKVVNILSGLLAVMDTNENLDILSTDMTKGWKSFLWQEIINDPEITQIRCSDFENGKKTNITDEFVVVGTSRKGNSFKSKMPFSWIVFRELSSIWRKCKSMPIADTQESELYTVLRTAKALETRPLGKLMAKINKEDVFEAIKDYVSDFVLMIYPVKSSSEHQFVCHNVLIGCKAMVHSEFSHDMLISLIGCHATFDLHEEKFRNFESIVQIWPECGIRCLEFLQKKHLLVTDEEITLDLIGLRLLLDTVEEPQDELMKLHENRVKWITCLCQYRPIVERILDCKDFGLSRRRASSLTESRDNWTLAIVMKLFLEHVCTEDSAFEMCTPLWTMMQKSNMKTVQSLRHVEKFLEVYKSNVAKTLLSKEICVHCESPFKANPVSLPCKHIICRNCLRYAMRRTQATCPLCQHIFKPDFKQDLQGERENYKSLKDFMGRCNSFFMDVVSQVCFAKGKPPTSDVVKTLLGHITVKTDQDITFSQDLTVFDGCLDEIPVVRSFLLQRLMQTSGPEVMQHLQTYFENAIDVAHSATDDASQEYQLYLLVLNCMEDKCFQQNPHLNNETISEATRLLHNSLTQLRLDQSQLLQNIQCLSQTRFAISIAGICLNAIYVKRTFKKKKIHQELFTALQNLFDNCNCKWPKYFLIKYFCKYFGLASYQSLRRTCRHKSLIVAQDLEQYGVEECCDRLAACDLKYSDIREQFVKLVLNENTEQFKSFLMEIIKDWRSESVFYLAIYREITMKWLQKEGNSFTEKAKLNARKMLSECKHLIEKDIVNRLLTNTVWKNCSFLNISPDMDLHTQGMALLLIHLLVILLKLPGHNTIMEPLRNIATQPERMIKAFLPTMPQDDSKEIHEEILKARTNDENPVLYRCPNGHAYIIGDCGRPDSVALCKTCGEKIGGESHRALPGNVKCDGTDRTQTGHILGEADQTLVLVPERKLSNVSCGVLRLLTHMAMLLGSDLNLSAVIKMIDPCVKESSVASFLIKHIDTDLSALSKTIGRSTDDLLLLMHSLFSYISTNFEQTNKSLSFLKNKDQRSSWESNIDQQFIIPFLEGTDKVLQKGNKRISKDERLGKSPLSQLLFETGGSRKFIQGSFLCDNPSIWQYRDHASVEHLKLMIVPVRQVYPVLNIFLEEDQSLRPLRFVPSIIRLQKHLLQRYKRRLDKSEANKMKLKTVKEDLAKEENTEELMDCLDHFQQAWSMTKEYIQKETYVVSKHIVQIKKELAEMVIDDNTPISFLLPSHTDEGLLSYILLYYLLQRQNLFLAKYRQSKSIGFHAMPFVEVRNIASTHLISYHPDMDLLPIVLANCNYTFHVGEGTTLEYNFATLESLLIDRFLVTKSDILLDEKDAIETMVYRSESTNAMVFQTLRTTIKQDKISHVVMGQIKNEMNRLSYPDLCDHIQNVDIAINFLKSLSRIDSSSSLNDFVVETLQLDDPCLNQKLKMSHIQCMWITLSFEKTKRLQDVSKESFDGIPTRFKETLTRDQLKCATTCVNELPTQRLSDLVDLLFECIVLTINTPQKDEETVDMAQISLYDAISQHVYDQPYENTQHGDNGLLGMIESLKKPAARTELILCSKCIETWKMCWNVFRRKQKEI